MGGGGEKQASLNKLALELNYLIEYTHLRVALKNRFSKSAAYSRMALN